MPAEGPAKNDPEQDKITDSFLLDSANEANTDRIDLCLKKGADINARNADGRTALIIAARKQNAYLARFIVNRGPDLFARDNAGLNAYDYAKKIDNFNTRQEITDILLNALPNRIRQAAPSADAAMHLAEKAANDTKAAAFNGMATQKPVTAVRPVTFGPKDDRDDVQTQQKPGAGGFKL
ncbi:MAG: ankyrin repeat domain-containing protein [Micavibrio sp.]|nr:ankyrin repeat domain-containing protein [Micavibrio sp.]